MLFTEKTHSANDRTVNKLLPENADLITLVCHEYNDDREEITVEAIHNVSRTFLTDTFTFFEDLEYTSHTGLFDSEQSDPHSIELHVGSAQIIRLLLKLMTLIEQTKNNDAFEKIHFFLGQHSIETIALIIYTAQFFMIKEPYFLKLEAYLTQFIDQPYFAKSFLAGNTHALQLIAHCDKTRPKKVIPHMLLSDSSYLDVRSGTYFGALRDTVTCSAFSPDGTLIATGSHDNTVKISNATNGALLSIINHSRWIMAVAFSPDGQSIATASTDNTAKVSNAYTGQLLYTIHHLFRVSSVAFSPNGTLIATGSYDETAKVSNALTGKLLYTINHNHVISSVAFSPDGMLIATGSHDDTVKISNALTGKLLYTINHDRWINAVAFSPDGKLIATGSTDTTAKVQNMHTGELIYTIKHIHEVRSIIFSPDGTLIVTTEPHAGLAHVHNAQTGEFLYTINNHGGIICSVAFSPDGTLVLVNDRLIPVPPLTRLSGSQSFLARTLKTSPLRHREPRNFPDSIQQLLQTVPQELQNQLTKQPRKACGCSIS